MKKVKEDEMDRACSMHRENWIAYKLLAGKKEKKRL
jgi:hypothetical protein